jgi:hypothetical protein
MTDTSTNGSGAAPASARPSRAAGEARAPRSAAGAKRAPAKRAPATKAAAKRAPAAKAPAKRAPAKRAPARQVTAQPPDRPAAMTATVEQAAPVTGGSPVRRGRLHIRRETLPSLPKVRLPGLNLKVPLPGRDQLPWVVSVCAAAAFELIEWPVALVIIVGHTVAANSHNEALREMAEGIEAVA